MDDTAPANFQISFNDPRLHMTIAGRLLVRVATWIAYLVLIAATFTFLMSSAIRLRMAGVFLGLLLVDILIHRGEGDVPISELQKSGAINVARVMRPATFAVLERTFDASVIKRKNFFMEAAGRFLDTPEVEEAMRRLDVPLKEFKEKLDEFAGELEGAAENSAPGVVAVPPFSETYLKQAEVLAVRAFSRAVSSGHDFIEIGDLFVALPEVGDAAINRLFNLFSVSSDDVERALIFAGASSRARGLSRLPTVLGGFSFASHRRVQHRIMNRAWTSRPTPTLDRYSVDLTDLAREGSIGFLVGHEEEYERLVETLARPTNPNALLIGEAGIGKEAIVQHLASRLAKDDVPKELFDKRLVSLALQNLIAGASPEVLDARLKAIVEEIDLAGNVILYIPDIHNLAKTSGTAYLSAADALMPVIMNNVFPIVGATYPKEFKQSIEPRSDFTGAFEVIRVGEITEAEAEKILTYESIILEKQAGVTISFGAVKRAVLIAKKYLHNKFLPSSAEELLKSAVAHAERSGDKTIGPDLITSIAEAETHIPMHEAGGDEAEKLLNMEEVIHERLVGQEEAVKAIATALREYRSGLARKGGPIASFLFVGPTGVGKTELAKILADIQFGSEKMMTRFDMTEYQDKASFVRFIGSPDGSSLTSGRGALTDAGREKPNSLSLLDEFEHAYPEILNLF